MTHLTTPTIVAAAIGGPAAIAGTVNSVEELVARIRDADDAVRGPAWQGAASHGAPAVKPLAAAMSDEDFEVARSARRALWLIVRHAGRPGAERESRAVAKELVTLLGNSPASVQREALWMLSEIGGDDTVAPIAALLRNAELRNDALCALMRIPGRRVTAALKSAFNDVSEEFKYALADSLRKRGQAVKGYPSQHLVPSRPTSVTHPPS